MVWRFVSWTCALGLVAFITMSIRTLFTSHARCWSVPVGSLPYLACHLAVCAFAIMLAVEARQCRRLLAVEANHPALKVSGVRDYAEASLEGPDRACGRLVYVAVD